MNSDPMAATLAETTITALLADVASTDGYLDITDAARAIVANHTVTVERDGPHRRVVLAGPWEVA